MKAEHYKEILLNEYESQELTKEDFKNTLEHFEKLTRQEVANKFPEASDIKTFISENDADEKMLDEWLFNILK